MRSTLCSLVTLWLCALPLAAQPSTSTEVGDPPSASPPAAAPAAAPVAAAPAAGEGTLITVVLAGRRLAFLPGVTVSAAGRSATTNDRGTAALLLPAGEHVARVAIPGGSVELPAAPVVAGEHTLVLATLSDDGKLVDASVQLPAAPVEQPSGQPPASGEQVGAPVAAAPREGESALSGRIVSTGGTPIANASVFVLGTTLEAQSDADGKFGVALAPGSYTVSIVHMEHTGQTLEAIQVAAGATTELRIELTPAPLEMESFVVRARRVEGGVASVMADRRQSAAVADSIGSEDISRMPASSAAQAAQRIVGANIVDGRFVYVRGLGERYINALLNGVPLPSPEPDRATVPLDLFPAQIIGSLDISKTFTPDVPGDFAGGSVRIVTRKVPDKPVLAGSLSLGYNSQSTFRDGYSQPAGALDFLGFDDGGRALSEQVPTDYALILGTRKPNGERVLSPELEAQSVNLNSQMHVEDTTLLPNLSASLVGGDGWDLGDEARLGVLASLIYSRSEKGRYDAEAYEYDITEDGSLVGSNTYPDSDSVTEAVRWGAFASTSLVLTKHHKLALIGMHSQLADATTTVRNDGFSSNVMGDIATSSMQFASRGLTLGQVGGNHEFVDLASAKLDWTLSLSRALRDEPDTRDVVYLRRFEAPEWIYLDGTDSGRHFFSEQDEVAKTAALDWTQPLTEGDVSTKLKTGGMVTLKDRTFEARRFTFLPVRNAAIEPQRCGVVFDPVECPATLFAEENIPSVLRAEEGTRGGDAYNASLYVYAGYLMGDLALGEQWRLVGGGRVESTKQAIAPFDQFVDIQDEEDSNTLEEVDILPAVSVVFAPMEDVNVRLSLTRTLARPQLRELAPFAFSDYFGGAQQSGNKNLKLTGILNGDVRIEVFPSPREVLALSVFAKDFTAPIEPVIIPSSSTDVLTYRNAPGAFLYGVEAEARKSLDFVHESLEKVTVIVSVMLAESSIRVEQTGTDFLTNTERPMVQSAPYVVNAAIDYENENRTQARLLYNVIGARLVEVGTGGIEDAYQHPQHLLDFTASQGLGEHFRLSATVQNLLDTEVLVTQGKRDTRSNVRERYRDGISASVGLSYTH